MNENIIEKISNILKEFVKNNNKIDLIYLYGSLSKNLYTNFSDIDLAIAYDLSKKINIDKRKNLLLTFNDYFSKKIPEYESNFDIKLLNDAPIEFCFNVINGNLLYARDDNIRAAFEEKVIKRYLDFKPYLDYYLKTQVELFAGDEK